MNTELVKRFAQAIANETKLPFIGPEAEAYAVRWVATLIGGVLPTSVLQVLTDASDGLSAVEIDSIRTIVLREMSARIDIPKVPSYIESMIYAKIIDAALDFLKSGRAI